MTMAASQLCIVTSSDAAQERANVQFHIQPLSLDRFGTPLHRYPAITVSPCNLRPTSRGTVRITSAAIGRASREIAPNYLVHRRRPPHRRRLHSPDPAADAPAGAGALPARRNSAPARQWMTAMRR